MFVNGQFVIAKDGEANADFEGVFVGSCEGPIIVAAAIAQAIAGLVVGQEGRDDDSGMQGGGLCGRFAYSEGARDEGVGACEDVEGEALARCFGEGNLTAAMIFFD